MLTMSSRKRKLCDDTAKIYWSRSGDILKQINDTQIEAFHIYEDDIRRLKNSVANLLKENAKMCRLYGVALRDINKKQVTLNTNAHALKAAEKKIMLCTADCENYKTMIDSMSMQMYESQMKHEEEMKHYKDLNKGLQNTLNNAEEAMQYITLIKKIIGNFHDGISSENCLMNSEKKCSLCLTVPANILNYPCKHLDYCTSCALKTFSLQHDAFDVTKEISLQNKHFNCIRCKAPIETACYIFL